jgi:hypothetical protein
MMRISERGKTVSLIITIITIFLAVSVVNAAGEHPGATFLLIWPTARSTALAGAMTALVDEADAAYWNPGGLGFQRNFGATGTFCKYLTGLPPQGVDMYYAYGSAGIEIPKFLDKGIRLNHGLNITYFTPGKTEFVNERGEYLGKLTTYRMAVGIHGGIQVFSKFGLGLSLKFIYSYLIPDWLWWDGWWYTDYPSVGINAGGTGSSFAVDIGALYKPLNSLSLGLA